MLSPTSLPSWLSVNRAVLEAVAAGASSIVPDAESLAHFVLARQEKSMLPSEYFAELIVDTIGADYFPVLKCLDSTTPNAVHRGLSSLARSGAIRAILTTNFDRAIEAAFEAEGVPLDIRFREPDLRRLADDFSSVDRGDTCHLVKLHGSASDPNTLVDTLSQRKRGLPAAALTITRHLLDRYHWLVLGFSGADLDADPGYLGLRAAADRGVGLTWLVRPGTTPLPVVQELTGAWGDRADLVTGELPQWLLQWTGSATPETRARQGAGRAGAETHAPPSQVLTKWVGHIGAPACGLILAGLVEASGDGDSALHLLDRIEAGWPDEESDALLDQRVLLHARRARLLAARGLIQQAADSLDSTLQWAVRLKDPRMAAGVTKQRGNLLRQLGRLAEAETVFRDALAIAPPDIRASVLADLAPVLALLSRDGEARESIRSAINVFAALGDEVNRAGQLVNLAALSLPDDAARLRGEAMAIFDRLGDESGRATVLLNAAKAARDAGDPDTARSNYEQARDAAARIGDRRQVAMALHGLAIEDDSSGDVDAAVSGYRSALAEAQAAGHLMEVASVLNNLGRLHRDRGEPSAAAQVRTRALEIYRSSGDVRGQADTLFSASRDHVDAGDPAAAVEPAREAAELFARLGDERRRVEALTNLAAALRESSRPRDAIGVYRSLLDLPQDDRWTDLVPHWAIGAGRAAIALGDSEGATSYLVSGIQLTADTLGLPAAAELAVFVIPDADEMTDGGAAARAVLGRLVEVLGDASRQARALAEAGHTRDAASLLISAADAAEHAGLTSLVGVSWTNLGRTFELADRIPAALESYAKGARAAGQADDLETGRIATKGAVRLLARQGNTDGLALAFEELADIEEAAGDALAAANARAEAASALLVPFGEQDGVTTRGAAHERAGRAGALLEAALPVLESARSTRLGRARYDADFVAEVLST
jgi:tetratricopeptide (TPR) repeat protein